MLGTFVDLIDTLKFSKSSRSISSTCSTAAATSASTGFSRSSSCRCLGSEPELTPIRIGTPACPRLLDHLGGLVLAADVARVDADAVRAGVDRLERERVVEVDVGDHRDRRLLDDPLERADVVVARHRAAHEVAARVRDGVDLPHGGVEVRGLRLGHGLHRDRSPPPIFTPPTSICFLEAMKPGPKPSWAILAWTMSRENVERLREAFEAFLRREPTSGCGSSRPGRGVGLHRHADLRPQSRLSRARGA